MFCLFYDSGTRKVHGINGSGRAPMSLTLDTARRLLAIPPREPGRIPLNSVLAITTPGAAGGWVDTIERFGSRNLSLGQILKPAISLAEDGFPVSEVSARLWQENENSLREASPNYCALLKTAAGPDQAARAPVAGEIMTNPDLAQTFRTLAVKGKDGFYRGHVADAMVEAVKERGGFLTHADLSYHVDRGDRITSPLSVRFKNTVDVWEHPPNGQGLIALMALRLLEELERAGKIRPLLSLRHNSADYIHTLVEVFRIAFADASWWISDPIHSEIPDLLSTPYIKERARLFNSTMASTLMSHGSPALHSCDTVYFALVDRYGNAASVVNSNYHGFGTGIVPRGCGFSLQSRGANFSLTPGHPNSLAPCKRPYHTIIPAMATNPKDGSLNTVFGIMGGFMQPQGHVQLLMNMLLFGMNPQQALDAPRVCIGSMGHQHIESASERTVYVEEGVDLGAVEELRGRGHLAEIVCGWDREIFGRGQIIRAFRGEDSRSVLEAGSDLRADGMALPV
ncbi:gamma-glutamyltranspeptidase family protein [Aspergillus costaricaensis CBS 115574]|uniref:Gamma-glutamyltranspeptidase family protein n=1 Tax=Aspergillus costaricaensis CBS 115574 TaxID=1448317 RepID=A0ACD1IC27_9EURO|nr:gamma-glutamyltranspeptidase family protein [Aspergillus costaricaensis CBS 115574]RAK87827.1 gamma-glutamyltranspeptidase family protein [Aspergillus costaricaensis CBS 115574]